jgi:hypothetical protein
MPREQITGAAKREALKRAGVRSSAAVRARARNVARDKAAAEKRAADAKAAAARTAALPKPTGRREQVTGKAKREALRRARRRPSAAIQARKSNVARDVAAAEKRAADRKAAEEAEAARIAALPPPTGRREQVTGTAKREALRRAGVRSSEAVQARQANITRDIEAAAAAKAATDTLTSGMSAPTLPWRPAISQEQGDVIIQEKSCQNRQHRHSGMLSLPHAKRNQ